MGKSRYNHNNSIRISWTKVVQLTIQCEGERERWGGARHPLSSTQIFLSPELSFPFGSIETSQWSRRSVGRIILLGHNGTRQHQVLFIHYVSTGLNLNHNWSRSTPHFTAGQVICCWMSSEETHYMFTNQFIRATYHFPVLNPTEYRYTKFGRALLCSVCGQRKGTGYTRPYLHNYYYTDTYLPT